jgi:DNA-binding protein H-NS
MSIDLSKMSKDELVALRKDVAAAFKDFDKWKKKEALTAAQKAAQEFGFRLEQVLGGRKAGAKVAPRYRNPSNSDQTWTGRGHKPLWVVDLLNSGKSLDDLAI